MLSDACPMGVCHRCSREEGFGTNNVLHNPPGRDELNQWMTSVEGRVAQRQVTRPTSSHSHPNRQVTW